MLPGQTRSPTIPTPILSQSINLTPPPMTGTNPQTNPFISTQPETGSMVVSTTSLPQHTSQDTTRSCILLIGHESYLPNINNLLTSYSSPSSGSFPLIIGLAAAVAAFACSLLGVGLYFVRRKRNSKKSIEVGTGLKGTGALPAGYTSIEAIQQGMASARAENQYDIVPGGKLEGHYSDPFSCVST